MTKYRAVSVVLMSILIAAFRGEQQKPYQVLQMPVQLLPEEDQGAIEAGIHVQTEQELRRLLEDFAS